MKTGPEHALQVKINQFVREVVPQPHVFFSIDRTAKRSEFEHVRQKARGLIAGISDTMLLYPSLPAIAVELKAPGKRPDDNQKRFGSKVEESGHIWGWCSTVFGYAAILLNVGVPMRDHWEMYAASHDAVLTNASIRREESKTGVPSKKRIRALCDNMP